MVPEPKKQKKKQRMKLMCRLNEINPWLLNVSVHCFILN